MTDLEILPAPDLKNPVKTPTKFENEMASFRSLLPSLLANFRNMYVAIHEGKVVASGHNILDVAQEAYEKFGYQPIYVDLVTDEPQRPERIPGPRNPAQ